MLQQMRSVSRTSVHTPKSNTVCSCRRGSLQVVAAAAKGFGSPKTPQASEQCPCGSKLRYKECCEQHHSGKSVPATPEAALRARFSAFCKDRRQYIADTTHPEYHSLRYGEGISAGGAPEKLKLEIAEGCSMYTFANLRILSDAEAAVLVTAPRTDGSTGGSESGSSAPAAADEALITFRYDTIRKTKSRHVFAKPEEVNAGRTIDGRNVNILVRERSRFKRGGPTGGWLLVDSVNLSDPATVAAAAAAAAPVAAVV